MRLIYNLLFSYSYLQVLKITNNFFSYLNECWLHKSIHTPICGKSFYLMKTDTPPPFFSVCEQLPLLPKLCYVGFWIFFLNSVSLTECWGEVSWHFIPETLQAFLSISLTPRCRYFKQYIRESKLTKTIIRTDFVQQWRRLNIYKEKQPLVILNQNYCQYPSKHFNIKV